MQDMLLPTERTHALSFSRAFSLSTNTHIRTDNLQKQIQDMLPPSERVALQDQIALLKIEVAKLQKANQVR